VLGNTVIVPISIGRMFYFFVGMRKKKQKLHRCFCKNYPVIKLDINWQCLANIVIVFCTQITVEVYRINIKTEPDPLLGSGSEPDPVKMDFFVSLWSYHPVFIMHWYRDIRWEYIIPGIRSTFRYFRVGCGLKPVRYYCKYNFSKFS
jgi:hypothetical protein